MQFFPLAAMVFGCCLLAQDISNTTKALTLYNQGKLNLQEGNYPNAAEALLAAANLQGTQPAIRLYLALAYSEQSVHVESAAKLPLLQKAEEQLQKGLDLKPDKSAEKLFLAAFGRVALAEAEASVGVNKAAKYDEATGWYRRLAAVDPKSPAAYYALGVISYRRFFLDVLAAAAKLGNPPDLRLLSDAKVRLDLRNRDGELIRDAESNLSKALAIDAEYAPAIAFQHLLLRSEARVAVDQNDWTRYTNLADSWLLRAFDAKRKAAQQGLGSVALPGAEFVARDGILPPPEPKPPAPPRLPRTP